MCSLFFSILQVLLRATHMFVRVQHYFTFFSFCSKHCYPPVLARGQKLHFTVTLKGSKVFLHCRSSVPRNDAHRHAVRLNSDSLRNQKQLSHICMMLQEANKRQLSALLICPTVSDEYSYTASRVTSFNVTQLFFHCTFRKVS